MHLAQTALRLREQMCAFLGNLQVCKTARRFALQARYGIQQSQSLMFRRIARALNEKIALIKTETRLSRQAAREGLDQALEQFVIDQGASRIGRAMTWRTCGCWATRA